MIGEVWLCSGQSNMDWNYYTGVNDLQPELDLGVQNNIRFFYIGKQTSPYPQDDTHGKWVVCDSNNLKQFSAVAYFYAKKLQQQLNVPIGLIQASWGGTPAEVWTPAEKIHSNATLKKSYEKLDSFIWWPKTPGVVYNAMLSPITNYSVAGAIWYQGEGNTAAPATYSTLLTTMIDSWRNAWKKNFPFYFVQIAPFTYGKGYAAAILREQQSIASKYDNTGMVVISDLVDDTSNIHPRNKKDVGIRLANMALSKTYAKHDVVIKYPVYDKVEFKDNKMLISFLGVGERLVSTGEKITAVEVAGSDRVFYPAEAKISNNMLEVWSKMVKKPVAVRYSFSNAGVGNLFSKFGLPVTPFRTDDWPVE
jgi:sialate O-acetylesterase